MKVHINRLLSELREKLNKMTNEQLEAISVLVDDEKSYRRTKRVLKQGG